MIKIRQMMIVSALAAGALAAPGVSQARTDVYVRVGPPPPIVEVVPAPRYGYAWAPGYWDWNGHRHVWHKGYYVRERPGYRWEAHRWVQHGDRWALERGRWGRGREG
jgi:YXWGXW repeat-containing protein